jgi:hypothetical protein
VPGTDLQIQMKKNGWTWLWYFVPVAYFLLGIWGDWYVATAGH